MSLSHSLRAAAPLRLCLLTVLALLAASPARAQSFGQNKVQYGHFDFQVLETPHFDIYFYTRERDAAREVARMAERWYGRLSTVLGAPLIGRQVVVLYASHAEFEQTNVLEGMIPEETGGVTEGLARRIVLPLAASLGESDHVLGHELVHAFQYSILGNRAQAMPLWFMEGMAEYLSLGNRYPQTAMWLRDALIREDLPTLEKLDDPRYFPYRFGHAFWSYIGGRWGDRMIGEILAAVSGGRVVSGDPFGPPTGVQAAGGDPIRVIERLTGLERDALSTAWHEAIGALYRPALADASSRQAEGAVTFAGEDRGSLRIGPALSPDGSRVAFLSERDRLSIELFVANARTGQVERPLTKTAADPHFDSLHFVESSGAWSPDGRQLAVAAAQGGRPVIAILSADNGARDREIPFPALGAVFQPSWSPDGRKIAFTAQAGGVTDLYLVDLQTNEVRQLTHDLFADLQPAWAPNSRDLAFVTDRFGGDLARLSFDRYTLARLDTETGAVSQIETGVDGNAVNPQWASDRELFFISDATGRPDVYRRDLSAARTILVATAPTGISGITALSPALSYSRASGTLAYSVFGGSGYAIQVLPHAPSEAPVAAGAGDLARLPGADRPSRVAALLRQPSEHLPPATVDYPSHPASGRLQLMDVAQSIGATTSTGAFGTYVSGGVMLFFSDVLGNHLLSTGINVAGDIKDTAFQASYLNRTSRWNWGLFGERVPLISGSVTSGYMSLGGQLLYAEQGTLHREIFTQAGAMVAYPFSRATRVELGASMRHVGFDDELRTQFYDPSTGDFLGEDRTDLGGDPALTFADATVALVRDTATFGAVSPLQGERFRFDVSPTFGGLRMVGTTLDYRRYVMPFRPLTIAGRLMHIGRYGMNGEDQRLLPLYLGYNTLVRGYDFNSFGINECTVTTDGSCPEIDRLIGSRIIVANLEARVPIVGLFTGRLDYGPVPAEIFTFFDAGTAWTRATTPTFAGGDRPWVRSVGFGARVNLLGFAIGEFNAARPIDRAGRGWDFVFNFRPGF
ncbi:MAG: PD40 domain-containing protein [Acidobacteria bacterium]|nr:PD40 domain-containing protein [Acidobacteriota bacterium]